MVEGIIRFDDRVVVITGAGAGLGRAYALFFAERGAKVVVNDLGGSHTGSGSSSKAADLVVEEIKSKGGVACANYDSVENGDNVIKTAIDNFGRVDVLINNAGILRDKAFKNMTPTDWELIVKVHLNGVYSCTKAAFPHMLQQKFGRIINVSSPSGLYGSYGQVNYSMAKSGIVGMTKSLGMEGAKYNVLCNAIAPIAATRMTETVLSKDLLELLKVDYVVPLVAYLAHESCTENQTVYEIGGKWISKVRLQRSEGVYFDKDFTPESIRNSISQINDFGRKNTYNEEETSIQIMVGNLEKFSQNKTSNAVLKSDEVFLLIQNFLGSGDGKDLIEKVNAVYQFDILEKKGGPIVKSWAIDLKTPGNGTCTQGAPEKYDALFTMQDEDFVNITLGKLNPQMAFIQGKMKIKGSMGKATKFTPDLFPKPTEENHKKYLKPKF